MILGPPLWATGSWGGGTISAGPSGTMAAQTRNFSQVDAQRAINVYPEMVEIQGSQTITGITGIPGLSTLLTLPTSPVRALLRHDGRVWAVSGTVLYELFSSGTYTVRAGGLINDGAPAYIYPNGYGGQLWVVSGVCGGVYTLSTNAWTPNVRTDVYRGGFCDGYFLSLDTTTSKLYSSDLEDGITWGGTSWGARQSGADQLVSMITLERLIWLLGTHSSEVWYNAGTSPFPFALFQGGFLEQGCIAADSVAVCDGSVMWLGRNKDGPASVWKSVGFKAQLVSTHVVARAIASYSTITDAVAFTYVDGDHAFYVLVFPTVGACWAFDVITQLWSERAYWSTSTGLWGLYKPRYHCFAFSKHLVGDGTSGAIYHMDPTTYTDAGGVPLRRMLIGPYIMHEQRWIFHRGLWLDVETGVGTSDDQTPHVMLAKSDDKGKSWQDLGDHGLGATGEMNTRVEWTRLGRARQRMYRVVYTDPTPFRIGNTYQQVEVGP